MSFALLDMLEVIFIILVADLAVSVVAVRNRLWDVEIVLKLVISVCLELPLQVLQVFLLPLFLYLVKLLRHKGQLFRADAWTEAARSIHLNLVNFVRVLATLPERLGAGERPRDLYERANWGLRLDLCRDLSLGYGMLRSTLSWTDDDPALGSTCALANCLN